MEVSDDPGLADRGWLGGTTGRPSDWKWTWSHGMVVAARVRITTVTTMTATAATSVDGPPAGPSTLVGGRGGTTPFRRRHGGP